MYDLLFLGNIFMTSIMGLIEILVPIMALYTVLYVFFRIFGSALGVRTRMD